MRGHRRLAITNMWSATYISYGNILVTATYYLRQHISLGIDVGIEMFIDTRVSVHAPAGMWTCAESHQAHARTSMACMAMAYVGTAHILMAHTEMAYMARIVHQNDAIHSHMPMALTGQTSMLP